MYKSRELFNIQTSIDNLSNKFTELENSYYSFLQKSQEENENIISKEVDVNSEFFQSLLKEQSYLQNNVKHLTALEKSFSEELNHLRSLIRHSKEEQATISFGDFREIQTLVEYGLTSLHENIFSIEGIKTLEQKVGNKIQNYFNNTSELFSQAFAEFPFVSKENIDDILSFKKLDDIYNTNANLFEAIDFESETLKTSVSASLKNINKFSTDFTKEAQSLQDHLNKARQEATNFLKGVKTLQKKSHGEGDVSQAVKSTCTAIEQVLSESVNWDSKKNETFVNIKGQIEEISKSVRNYLRDFKKQFESIKANNDIMKSVTQVLKTKNPELATASFPNTTEREENKHSSKLQVQTAGSSKKMAHFLKPGKETEDLSSIRGESYEVGSSKDLKTSTENKLELEKISRQTREQLEGLISSISQRFGYLKTSSKSLLMSGGKLLRLVIKKGGEDDFVFKVYENDKKGFENYLNAVEEAIITSKEKLERIRTKSSKKSISAVLPEKSSAGSKQSADFPHKKKHANKKAGDPKIKALIDDFEHKHGEVFRSLSPKNSPGVHDKNVPNLMLSSEGFHKTLPTFGSPKENSPQLKSLEFELLLLQKRCEELGKERDRLKKEMVDVKKQPNTTDLIPKVQELSEHNDRLAKDNAKLVKLAKKLEHKAVERKGNLKKLFDLMEEKERELKYYKANTNANIDINQVSKQVEQLVSQKQNDMKKQIEKLVHALNEKEESLSNLEDFVTKIKPTLLTTSKRGNLSKTTEFSRRHDDEHSGMRGSSKEDTVVLDKKKRQITELINQISSVSTTQIPKIKDVVNFLKEERDDIGERLKSTKLSVLEQSDRSNISKDKITSKATAAATARDIDELKEKVRQQVEQLHELEVERDDLAERCNELVGELEVGQDLRKKVEKNYQEEIGVLNNKIHQLNEYIQEMEAKNNEKFRGSLTAEKWKKNTSGRDEAQQNKEDNEQRELIENLQIELQDSLGRIDEAAEYLGVVDESYNEAGVVGRLETVIGGFLAREEEFEKRYQELGGEENSTRQQNGERDPNEEIQELVNQNNALEELVETIKIELNERVEDNKELGDMLQVKDNEIEKLSKVLQEKETESQKIVGEFKALEEFSEKVEAEYQGHIEKLANLLANYGIPLDTNETELTKFAEQLIETVDSTLEAVARMKQEFEAKGGNKDPEEGEQVSSRGDIQELAAENEALREALENMNSELEQARNDREQIMGEFEGLVAPEEFEAVNERRQELEKEVDDLKVLLQEKENILKEKESKVAEISVLLSEKEKVVKEHESQHLEAKSKFSKNMDEMNTKFWKDTEQYNIKIQNLTKQAAKLKEQLQNTNQSLDEAKQQNDELFQIKLHLEEELITKSDECNNLKNELENAQPVENTERVGELERQIEEVRAEIDNRDQLIIQVNEEKTAVEQELARVYQEVEEFEKQFEALKEEKIALEKELEKTGEEIFGAQNEIESLNEQLKAKEDEVDNIRYELKDADAEIEGLVKEKQELEVELQKLQSEAAKESQEEVTQLREKIEELEGELADERYNIESKNDEVVQLKEKIQELEGELTDVKGSLETENEQYQEEINNLKIKIEELEGELTDARDSLEAKNQKLEELESELTEAKDNIEAKNQQLDGLKETNNLLVNDMSFFKATHEELSKQIEAKAKENKQKDERIQKLVASVEEYDQALKESNLDLERKDQVLDEIRESMDKLTEANTRLEETVKHLEHQTQERENEENDNEELINQIQALQEENENLKAQIEELEAISQNKAKDEDEEVAERIFDLEQENEMLKKQIKENEILLDDKDTEIRELEYEREKFLDEVNEFKQAKEKEIEAFKSESDLDRASRQDLENANGQLEQTIETLIREKTVLTEQLTEKENNLVSLREQITREQESGAKLVEQEGILAKNLITIKEQADAIQEKDLKIAQYQTALETAEGRIESLEKELGDHKDEKDQLTRQVSNLGEEMEVIREHKEETLKGKAKVEKDSQAMESRIQELETNLEEANNRIQEYEQQLTQIREEKEHLEAEIGSEIQAKEELQASLTASEEKVANGESLLKDLEALRLKVTGYESQIESDKARLESVEEELRQSREENEKYVELLESKEAEILELNTKLTEYEEDALAEKNEKEQEMSDEIVALKSKVSEYEIQIEQVNEEIALLQQEVEKLKSENEGFEAKVQEVENDKIRIEEEFNSKISEYQENIHDLEAQLKESEHTRENLVITVETREREFNDLKDTLSGKENELVERRVALEREKDEEIKNLREGVTEYKEKFEEARKQNEEQIKQLEAKLLVKDEELSTQASLMEEKDTEIDALKTWYAEAETKLKQAQEQIEALQNEINTIQQQKEEELEEMRGKFTEYEGTLVQAEKRVAQLEEQLKAAHEEVESYQQELATLTENNQNLQEEVYSHKKEVTAMKLSLDEKENEFEEDQNRLREAEQTIEQYENELNQLKEEIERLQIELKSSQDLTQAHTEDQNKLKEAEQTIEQYEADLNTLKEDQANKEVEIERLQTEVKTLQDLVKTKEAEAEKAALALNEVEEEYHEENQRLHGEIEELKKEYDHKEEQHNQDMNNLNDEFGELRNIILERDEELNHKDGEIQGLHDKITELEKKIEAAEVLKTDRSPMPRHLGGGFEKFTSGNEFDDFENQFDQFEDFEESFSADFKKRGGLSKELIAKKEELNDKVIHLQGSNTQLEEKLTELKASENNLRAEVEDLKKKLAESEVNPAGIKSTGQSRSSLEPPHERIEHLEREVEELNGLLMMRNNELAEMRTHNVLESQRAKTDHDEQIDQLHENIEELRQRNEEILNELEAVQSEYDVLKRSFDDLQMKNDKLHLEFKEYKEKEGLTISRGRTSELMRSPEFSPDKPIGGKADEIFDSSDPDQVKLRLADYERKVEKLKVDRRGLKENNHNLKEENTELRKTMKMFQEQIVMLNQTSQPALKPENASNNDITGVLQESFNAMQNIKSFRGKFSFKGDDAEEVRKAMNFIRESLHNNDLEIDHLNQVIEENKGTISSQDKLHEEAQKEINLLEEVMIHKISLILTETEAILRDIGLDTPAVSQDLKARQDLVQEEKLIYSCLRALRMVAQEARTQKTSPKLTPGISFPPSNSGPESKSLSLQIKPIQYNDSSPSRTKTGESSNKRRELRDRLEPSFSVPDEADDAKARSFIEEESYDIEQEIQGRPDMASPQNEKEYIQRLLSEIRNLQDENDQLDSEYKQLKNDFEILKFLNEDLKADIVDKDDRIKKLLETMMNEKGENKSGEFDEEKAKHEKEGLKKIFLKFFDSALQGTKDAEDLFKLLLTLLEIPEQDKNMLLTGFKSKASKKGGMFSKMFK